jgi:hypothetical protein
VSNFAKILSLSYDSAVAKKTSALKSYYRSVRLIKDHGVTVPTADSKYTNILLCGNCVDPETRNLYVFYIDILYHAAWIIEINIDNRVQTVVYYDKYNNIGFDPLHKIYNPRVVYGRIIWTDNVNPIYQMDVARAKRSFALGIGYGQNEVMTEWNASASYATERIVSNGNNFYKALSYNSGVEPRLDSGTVWQKLCLIEDAYYSINVKNFYFEPVPPTHPPEVTYQSNDTRKINNLRQTLFQVAYRYVYMDWRKSTYSPASIVPVPQAEEETATGLANEQVSLNNKLQIVFNSGGEEVRAVEIIGRSSQDPSKWFLIDTIYKFEEQERNSEISKTSFPGNIILGIAVMTPTVSTNVEVGISQIGEAMTIPQPVVINRYLFMSNNDMVWDYDQYDIPNAVDSQITIIGSASAILTSRPSWITIFETIHNTPIAILGTVINSQTIGITPASENLGAERTGTIVFEDVDGNTASITVTQLPSNIPPTVTVQIGATESQGMTLSNTSGNASNGVATIDIIFTPLHPSYGYGVSITIYYNIQKNGVYEGSGNFSVLNQRSNTKTLTMNDTAQPGDVIVVSLVSSLIEM